MRELLPHAAWSGIEWLLRLVGAILITAIFAGFQWFKANLNIVLTIAIFLGSFAILGLTSLGSAVFGPFEDWFIRRLGPCSPPGSELSSYLAAFLGRKRSLLDSHLESSRVIEKAKFPVADVPFDLGSSPLENAITRDEVGRTRTVRVPRFVELLFSRSGLGPGSRRRREKQVTVFVFLGPPASGKSSLMIQIAKWVAVRAESDSRYPVPVYVNLTHYGEPFSGTDGLIRLLRLSIRQACPRYLSTKLDKGETPVREEMARMLSAADSSTDVLYIFDGLDEVPAKGKFANLHKDRIASIAEFIEARPQHMFLVTCRVEDYVALRSYAQNFAMAVNSIRPWSHRLFRSYVDARIKSSDKSRRFVRRLVATANDNDAWGSLCNTPLLAAMLLEWPEVKGTPTAGELWEHFIEKRLRLHVGKDAYDRCVLTLERLGMALTVSPDRPLKLDPDDVEAAERAGLIVDTTGISVNPEFVIKPVQHYFAARFMLTEIRNRSRISLELAHRRFRSATRLLIEIGKQDPSVLQYLVDYLISSHDVHEAARRFETCVRSLTAKQLEAADQLEDALLAIIDRVLAGGDSGDMFLLIEGIKSLPSLLSGRRERAVLLLNGLAELGTVPIRRRLLQLCARSPSVFLRNPLPFLRVFVAFINDGIWGRELSTILDDLPASSQTVRATGRVFGRVIRVVSKCAVACYLYVTYLLGVIVANWLGQNTAFLFGINWPFGQRASFTPQDRYDVLTRLVFMSLTTVLPWFLIRRSAIAGFRNLSILSRVVTLVFTSGLLRSLLLLPVLGVLVVTTIPSGLEFVVTLALFVAPLAVVVTGVWLLSGVTARRQTSIAVDGVGGHDFMTDVPDFEGFGLHPTGLTRSPTVAFYSGLLALFQAARKAMANSRHRKWIIAGVVLAVILISLLWIHRMAWTGCFLLVVTGAAIYFERRFYRYYRECIRTLANVRGQLAGLMRQDFESTLTLLLSEILDEHNPLFIRKKYLQFIASDVPWDRSLIGRFREALETDDVPIDVRSYIEILIATKTSEVEMRESPNLDREEMNDLFGDAGDERT